MEGDVLKYYLGIDVGGTNIKASIISSDGEIIDDIKIFDSKSKESKESIINNFKFIINEVGANLHGIKLSGIGLAFPGPFEYVKGISYIKGLNKYDHLYGVNLRYELTDAIEKHVKLKTRFEPGFEINFSNDGDLFLQGEYLGGYAKDSVKAICVSIGTGAGSSFLENGSLVKNRDDVPKDGWIFHVPYREGNVDDYISARGIMKLCCGIKALDTVREVSQLYDLAMAGNNEAKYVFRKFGKILREIMLPFFDQFNPDTFVVGGQISKSFVFFGEDISEECRKRDIKHYVSDDTSRSVLKGVASLFK